MEPANVSGYGKFCKSERIFILLQKDLPFLFPLLARFAAIKGSSENYRHYYSLNVKKRIEMDQSAEEHRCDSHKSITTEPSEVGLVLHPFVPFGRYPQQTYCPHCHQRVPTIPRNVAGNMTLLVCCGICLLGGFCCCCLVPFCIDDLQDCEHYCSNCSRYLGTFERF